MDGWIKVPVKEMALQRRMAMEMRWNKNDASSVSPVAASKQLISKLQALVSSDGRFKNMRDALRTCEPPCIPYLGMYLTDLSFIEEGTPTTTEEGLVNFAKMRMIALVISEIQRYQSTPYQIEYQRQVASYLLDTSQLLEEDDTYRSSLEMEPRTSRSSIGQLGQAS